MVESNLSVTEIISKIKEIYTKNPLYNHDLKEVNWAMVGSFEKLSLLLKEFKLEKDFESKLNIACKSWFNFLKKDSISQRDINYWSYKYYIVILLTDPKSEEYEASKRELISHIISLCKDDNDEFVHVKKLCSILYFLSITFYAFHLLTIALYHFKIDNDGFQQLEDNQKDDSVDSYYFEDVLEDVETDIKKILPDFHNIRVSNKIFLEFTKLFGTKLSNIMGDLNNKNENCFEPLLYSFESNDNLLGLTINEEALEDSISRSGTNEDDIKCLQLLNDFGAIKSEEVEKAIEDFVKLDLVDMIIKCTFSFTQTKTLKDFCYGSEGSDSGSHYSSDNTPDSEYRTPAAKKKKTQVEIAIDSCSS